jgi:hypothetical protein
MISHQLWILLIYPKHRPLAKLNGEVGKVFSHLVRIRIPRIRGLAGFFMNIYLGIFQVLKMSFLFILNILKSWKS